MNKKTILIIFSIFILINTIIYKIVDINAKQSIDTTLKHNIQRLETHYNIILRMQNIIASRLYDATINDKFVIDTFSKARYASKEQQKILRDKLQIHLKDEYERVKKEGVLQYQFQFPNNVTFLRMHKPSKFGDDLTDIRKDYALVNKTKKSLKGFSKGKTDHGFRNVFTIFDFNGKYLGAMEVSFPSEYFQKHLTEISHIHTNFLVNKNIFKSIRWKRDDINLKYQQSAEDSDYMIAMTPQHTKKKDIIENIKKLKPIKEEIHRNIKKGKAFAKFVEYNGDIEVVSFVPIKTINHKTVAWLVAYQNSNFIKYTLNEKMLILVITFLFTLILTYFIVKQQKLINRIKTTNINLAKKTKEQSNLLSLFQKGDILLFLWNNDKHWSVDFVSNNTEKMLGYTRKDFLENNINYDSIIHNDDKQLLSDEVNDALINDKDFFTHKPYRIITKDGDLRWILDNTLLIKDKNGTVIQFLGSITDITQTKENERILSEQSKLASMGEMIGNIAHQWRQPLSIISTGATGMKLKKEFDLLTDEEFNKICDQINENAQYLSQTINDFRNFIKGDRVEVQFNLSNEIKSFLHLIEGTIKSNNIKIIKDLEDITIKGYPNELTQCFINIFNNAKDVFKEKDEIKERLFFISTSVKNDKIYINLKDNGGGIPKDVLPKIFDPYFTTKHKSQGTGLGLNMSYNMITNGMNGSIIAENVTYNYENKEYLGAEFQIILP